MAAPQPLAYTAGQSSCPAVTTVIRRSTQPAGQWHLEGTHPAPLSALALLCPICRSPRGLKLERGVAVLETSWPRLILSIAQTQLQLMQLTITMTTMAMQHTARSKQHGESVLAVES